MTAGVALRVALAVALAALLVVHARVLGFVCDDAYISFRYAENLVRHGSLVYNLGERLEGYTLTPCPGPHLCARLPPIVLHVSFAPPR